MTLNVSQTQEIILNRPSNLKYERVIAVLIDGSSGSHEALTFTLKSLISKNSPKPTVPAPTADSVTPTADLIVLIHCREFNYDYNLYFTSPRASVGWRQQQGGMQNFFDESTLESSNKFARDTAAQIVTAAAKQVKSFGVDCEGILLVGDARVELDLKIAELKPSMVVCGSRGLGVVTQALLGSTSLHLLHHCHCPVIVVPLHEEAK